MVEITVEGNPVQTVGPMPKIGTMAPDFIVTKTDLSEIHLKNYLGRPILMNVFPSLDTETCADALRKYNEIAQHFPGILILCISADLPFAQKRFCVSEHLDSVHPVSVFRHPGFGEDYGLAIAEGPLKGLLARAVVLLDANGKIVYTQLVKELTHEPDYQAIKQALQKQFVHM